ncbi:putative proteinH dehydrogenase, quinone family [Pseudomonas syringae pv. maculicola]|uniref:Flavodoxin-like fold domain-containing protein n=1 Tax=Pseudomonas syringae pv. maculicola TaxID=59511 RepID=A0A3M2X5U5_PSEYM|nr:putative proteinH dehydrogenase, quinone family [Pseudomonas syringae pv. maculicola]
MLTPGFAFKAHGRKQHANELLRGRTAELLVAMDTPPRYFRWIYGAPAHRQMVRTILSFCGIKTTRLTEFAPIHSATEQQRQEWIVQAQALGKR